MVPGSSKPAGTVAGLSQVAVAGHRPRSTEGELRSDVLQRTSPRPALRTLVPSDSDGSQFKNNPKNLVVPVRGSSPNADGEIAVCLS
jgi:hypothetical protein